MDWTAGQVLNAIGSNDDNNNTIVLFTSNNVPWVAEQSCSGSKGPWKGQCLYGSLPSSNNNHCPHDYQPNPTAYRPHRCTLVQPPKPPPLEANLRMPACLESVVGPYSTGQLDSTHGRIHAGYRSNHLIDCGPVLSGTTTTMSRATTTRIPTLTA